MADQVEVPKLTQTVTIGPTAAQAVVSKLVVYVLLEPGSDSGDTSNRQGHVHTQIIRR